MNSNKNKLPRSATLIWAVSQLLTWNLSTPAHGEISPFLATAIEEKIQDDDGSTLDRTEKQIARLMQDDPSDKYASYLMSTLLLKMFVLDPGAFGLIRQSTDLAAQTFELDNTSELGVAALANVLDVSGEYERGLQLIDSSLKRGVTMGWRLHASRAKLLSNTRNFDLILKEIELALIDQNSSKNLIAPVLINTIISKYDDDQRSKELAFWRDRCKATAMDLAVASSLAFEGQLTAAQSAYSQILAKSPHLVDALLGEGIVSLKLRKFSVAEHDFMQLLQVSNDDSILALAKTNLALALILERKSDTIVMAASYDAIKAADDQESTLISLVTAFRQKYGIPSTLRFLLGLETSVPGIHLGYAIKGELLGEKLGRYDEADYAFTDALTLEPRRGEYYNGRGIARMGLGRVEYALADFETAVTVNPDDASARYNVGCALARLGRKSDAVASLAKAFELDERLQESASKDHDLASLQSDPNFQQLLTQSATLAH